MSRTVRHSRLRTTLVASASAILALGVGLTAQAVAGPGNAPKEAVAPAVPAPPAAPTSDDQFQNIDQVRTAIKAYYGDVTTETNDPINGTTALHTYDEHGAYAKQTRKLVRALQGYLVDQTSVERKGDRAIVLDVDDTSLNTFNYEIYSNFAYSPTSNGAFVNAAAFPKVPRMPNLAQVADRLGYTIFFLTGRPEAQRAGTVTNLDDAGFPSVPAEQLYLKDQTAPWLSGCAPSCTTIQYKSLTRAHIKSLGYTIIANVGDQDSDLAGGQAKKTFKLPNPMYYLP